SPRGPPRSPPASSARWPGRPRPGRVSPRPPPPPPPRSSAACPVPPWSLLAQQLDHRVVLALALEVLRPLGVRPLPEGDGQFQPLARLLRLVDARDRLRAARRHDVDLGRLLRRVEGELGRLLPLGRLDGDRVALDDDLLDLVALLVRLAADPDLDQLVS